MMIRDVRPEDTESWLVMRMALLPETDEPQHRREMAMMLSDDERFAVAVVNAGSRFVARGGSWQPTPGQEREIPRAALDETPCKRL